MNNYIYNEILNFNKNGPLNDLNNEKIEKKYFWNQCFDKSRLKNFVLWFLSNYGEYKTVELVEELKNLGFQYATKAGISLGIDDLKIPPKKTDLMFEAEKLTLSTSNEYKRGEITGVERFQRLIDTWHRTSERLKQEVIDHFEATDILNPVYMMAFSGARGNISQVRQLVGMRGLMANPQGQIIDFPIRSNFREGLTLTEYVISSYGARKGIVDTALRTANAGYLTRRLVDVAQHVIISNFDCKTRRGIFLMDMKEGNKTIYSLQNRLVGRVLAKNIYSIDGQKNIETIDKETMTKSHSLSPALLAKRNTEISVDLAFEIAKVSKKVFVRSSLTCGTKKLVCQLCYGWSLAQGNLVSIGEAVGVIAAQSIGEPGTQLTMRTFHTGGVFSGDVTDQIKAPFNGFIEYIEPIAGTLIRTPEGKIAFLTKMEGSFIIKKNSQHSISSGHLLENNLNKDFKKYKIPAYTLIFKRMGEIVFEKEVMAQISSISRQKNATDDAELTIKSDFEGQFYAKKLELQETKVGPKLTTKQKKLLSNFYKTRKSNAIFKKKRKYSFSFYLKKFKRSLPLDNVYEAWNWGYAWILSGKIYQLQYPSSFFPILGDYVNRQTLMNEIKCRFHGEGLSSVLEFQSNFLLNPNKKGFLPFKKERIFKDRALISSYFKTSNLNTNQYLAKEVGTFDNFFQKSNGLEKRISSTKSKEKKEFKGINDSINFPIIKNSLLNFDLKKIFYKKFGYWINFNEGLNPSFLLKKMPLKTSLRNFLENIEIDKNTKLDSSFLLSKKDLLLLFSSFNQNQTNPNFNKNHLLSNFEDKSTSFSTSNWLPNSKFILTWYPKNSEINIPGLLSIEEPSFISNSLSRQTATKHPLDKFKKNHIFFISSDSQKKFGPNRETFVFESQNVSQTLGFEKVSPSLMNEFFKIKKQKMPLSFKVLNNDLFLTETNQKTLKTNDFTDVISLLKEKKYKNSCERLLNFKNVFILNNLKSFLKNKNLITKQFSPKFDQEFNPISLDSTLLNKKVNAIRNKGDLSYFFLKKELLKKIVYKNNKFTKEKSLNSPLVGSFNHSFFKLNKNLTVANEFKKKKQMSSNFNSGSNLAKTDILIYNLNKGEELHSVHFGMRWKNSYNYKNISLNYLLRNFDLNSLRFKTMNNLSHLNMLSNKKMSKNSVKNSKNLNQSLRVINAANKAAEKITNLSQFSKNPQIYNLTFRKQSLTKPNVRLFFIPQVGYQYNDSFVTFLNSKSFAKQNFQETKIKKELLNFSTVQLTNKPLFYQINRQGYVKFFYIKKNMSELNKKTETNSLNDKSLFIEKRKCNPTEKIGQNRLSQEPNLDILETNSQILPNVNLSSGSLALRTGSKFVLAKLTGLPNLSRNIAFRKTRKNLPKFASKLSSFKSLSKSSFVRTNSLERKNSKNFVKLLNDKRKEKSLNKKFPNITKRNNESVSTNFYNVSQSNNFKLILKLRNLLKEKTLYRMKHFRKTRFLPNFKMWEVQSTGFVGSIAESKKNTNKETSTISSFQSLKIGDLPKSVKADFVGKEFKKLIKQKIQKKYFNQKMDKDNTRLLSFSKEKNLNLKSFSKKIIYKSILQNKLIFNLPVQQKNKLNISGKPLRVSIAFSQPSQIDKDISIFNLCNFINMNSSNKINLNNSQIQVKKQALQTFINRNNDKDFKKSILSKFIKFEMIKNINGLSKFSLANFRDLSNTNSLKNSTISIKNQKLFNNENFQNVSFGKNYACQSQLKQILYRKNKNLCSNRDIAKISQNLDFRLNKLNAMLNVFFKAIASSASTDFFSKISKNFSNSLSTFDFLRGSVKQLRKDQFRKTIQTKESNLSLQIRFHKKSNVSVNQKIKMAAFSQSKNTYYFQAKFGWLYFSKNLLDYISFHKKFISPGKQMIDDLIFQNHSYYVEYVSLNRDFSNSNISKNACQTQSYRLGLHPLKNESKLSNNTLKAANKWNWITNNKSRFLPSFMEIKKKNTELVFNNQDRFESNSYIRDFSKVKIGILIRKVNEYKEINLSNLKNSIYNFSNIKNKLYSVSALYEKKGNFAIPAFSNLNQRSLYLKNQFISKIFFKFHLKKSLINETNQQKIRNFYVINQFLATLARVRASQKVHYLTNFSNKNRFFCKPKFVFDKTLNVVEQNLEKLQSSSFRELAGEDKFSNNYSVLRTLAENLSFKFPISSAQLQQLSLLIASLKKAKKSIKLKTFFINKSLSSLSLLNKEYKNPLINKQKITLQTISNFPNIDLNISSNFAIYYAKKGNIQKNNFYKKSNSFASNAIRSDLAPSKNRKKSKEFKDLHQNLKSYNKKTSSISKNHSINKISDNFAKKSLTSNFKPELISLPIFCRKPINFSSFFLAFNQSYGLKGTFPTVFSLFNYRTNVTFNLKKFNNSYYLNLFLERYILKLFSYENNFLDNSNLSVGLNDISIKTRLNVKSKVLNLDKGQLFTNLVFSEITALIPTMFNCPCFSYSLTQHLDKTFFIDKNFNPSFFQKDKTLQRVNSYPTFKEIVLIERKMSKLNALSNKIELKTQFFSRLQNKFRSSDVLAKIAYYSSFEGELIYKKDLNSLVYPESGRNSKTDWLFPIYNENTALILTKDDLISFSLHSKKTRFNQQKFSGKEDSHQIHDQKIKQSDLESEKNKKYYINNILIKLSNFDEFSLKTSIQNKPIDEKIQQTNLSLNNFTNAAAPKLSNLKSPKQMLLKVSKLASGLPSKVNKLYLGEFVMYGDKVKDNLAILNTGQILHMNQQKITLRRGQPIFISPKAIFHKYHGDLIHSKASVITLAYSQLKTGDIIQGIPKVEQFFEARTTKRGRLFRDSLPNLLKALFKRYLSKLSFKKAVRQSFYKIQQIIIDGVQRVYRSQGVSIADKHLEIIVKQMTSKVRISFAGVTGFFPGEIVDLHLVEYANDFVTKKVQYEPLVLGITKASLEVTSFLSAASFQQTTRVLSKATVSRKSDFLKGLKENVILGNLIPAGTGLLVYLEKQKVIDSIIEEKTISSHSELIKNLVTKK